MSIMCTLLQYLIKGYNSFTARFVLLFLELWIELYLILCDMSYVQCLYVYNSSFMTTFFVMALPWHTMLPLNRWL
jgi:hypothetical protein